MNRKSRANGFQVAGQQADPISYILAADDDKRSIWYLLRTFYGYTQKQMELLMEIDIKKYRGLEREEIFPDSEIILKEMCIRDRYIIKKN